MALYKNTSPWFTTTIKNNELGFLNIRPVSAEDDDHVYIIEMQYRHRPDLLAYDLYGNSKLWWVFMHRNMDVITDPIYDFEPGVKIFVPKKTKLFKSLGL